MRMLAFGLGDATEHPGTHRIGVDVLALHDVLMASMMNSAGSFWSGIRREAAADGSADVVVVG